MLNVNSSHIFSLLCIVFGECNNNIMIVMTPSASTAPHMPTNIHSHPHIQCVQWVSNSCFNFQKTFFFSYLFVSDYLLRTLSICVTGMYVCLFVCFCYLSSGLMGFVILITSQIINFLYRKLNFAFHFYFSVLICFFLFFFFLEPQFY